MGPNPFHWQDRSATNAATNAASQLPPPPPPARLQAPPPLQPVQSQKQKWWPLGGGGGEASADRNSDMRRGFDTRWSFLPARADSNHQSAAAAQAMDVSRVGAGNRAGGGVLQRRQSTVLDQQHSQQMIQFGGDSGSQSASQCTSDDASTMQTSLHAALHTLTCTVASMKQRLASVDAVVSNLAELRKSEVDNRRRLESLPSSVKSITEGQQQVAAAMKNLRDDLGSSERNILDLKARRTVCWPAPTHDSAEWTRVHQN
jgi:hypothetical protein